MQGKMRAVRIHPAGSGTTPFSPSNPAPSSSLVLDQDVRMPQPEPGQVLVRVHAAAVTRDELKWPESYREDFHILGYDFSGVVDSVRGVETFKPGDEVFAMYVVVDAHELALKPKTLDWAEAATVPMSVLTAWQALFVKGGIPAPDFITPIETDVHSWVLVTGATGAVGSYILRLATLAGWCVIAATSSKTRNKEFLLRSNAAEVIDYSEIKHRSFDIIIDTVGGEALANAWSSISDNGTLVSVDSSSFAFADNPPAGKEGVKAIFFVVEPSGTQLSMISWVLERGLLSPLLADTFPFAEARAAYERANGRTDRRGKVALMVRP
ncbi:hypothetical protein QQX98_006915 [Neonectria punicea]|uniref:Enoyl reductase (ER) domain-containing protein n=1 Tax=Neonectria punicea TaxID=979145 RepID=A0ABR1GZF0_9HYPO